MEYLSKILSKFAFIFLIFVVISSGFLQSILSCQMQYFLKNITYGKHVLGIIMVFVFIMLEGGWSFNLEENEMASNDWSSGNAFHSLIFAVLIYFLLSFSSKSRLVYNIIFYVSLFILYIINTQRSYYHVRKLISDETNYTILLIEEYLFFLSLLFLLYGFIDYIIYQRNEYKNNFSWFTFLSTNICKKI